MRCDNCGWMNPEGAENCQKCNQKLRPSHFEEHKVVNVPKQEPAPVPAVVNCDKCGREYSLQMSSSASGVSKGSRGVNSVSV